MNLRNSLRLAAAVLIAAGAAAAVAAPPAKAPAPAAGDLAVRVGQVVEGARTKADAGETAEALADLRAANALVKQAKGAEAAELLPILDMAAELLVADGQLEQAESPLKRAIAVREALAARKQPTPPEDLAGSLVTLGTVRAARGGHADARPLLDRGASILAASLGPAAPATLAARLRLAEVQLGLGDFAAAEESYREVLTRGGGDAAAEFAAAAIGVARCLAIAGRPEQGSDVLTEAIAARRAAGGGAHVAELLRELAAVHLAVANTAEAAEAADAALALDRRAHGDASAAADLDRLLRIRADVAIGDGSRLEEADTIADRLATAAAASPDAPAAGPLAAAGLRCAGLLAADMGDLARAGDRWKGALDADEGRLGADHPDTASDRAGLARVLLAAGDAAAARPLAEQAADSLAIARGAAHAEALEAAALAGIAAAAAGDLDPARTRLDAVLAAGAPRSGPHADRDLARLAEGVAVLAEKAGDAAAATAARDAPLEVRRRQFGESSPQVIAMLVQLADARHDAGGPAAAVPLYESALSLTTEARGADDPEVAAILTPLARSLRATGANAPAAEALARALVIWEATVGPDHPTTIATVKALALVYLALERTDDALPLMTRLLAAYDADPATPPADVARLLRRMATIHEARGEGEIARKLVARADRIEKAAAADAAKQP